jgi:hypothetical protein
MDTNVRPDILPSATYKIKSHLYPHAFYLTLSDMVIDAGTDNERKRPYEILINSKNVEGFQWMAAFTRLISMNFRMNVEPKHLIAELREVYDPVGGFYDGGIYYHSLVAKIGTVIETHLKMIGAL